MGDRRMIADVPQRSRILRSDRILDIQRIELLDLICQPHRVIWVVTSVAFDDQVDVRADLPDRGGVSTCCRAPVVVPAGRLDVVNTATPTTARDAILLATPQV